jgi:hypothetical protein
MFNTILWSSNKVKKLTKENIRSADVYCLLIDTKLFLAVNQARASGP